MNTQIYKLLKSSNIEDIVLGLTMWKSLDFRHFSNNVTNIILPELSYFEDHHLFVELDTGKIFFYVTFDNEWCLNKDLLRYQQSKEKLYYLI